MSLRDLLVDADGQLDDVETTLTPDAAITWSRAQRRFTVLAADGASAEAMATGLRVRREVGIGTTVHGPDVVPIHRSWVPSTPTA